MSAARSITGVFLVLCVLWQTAWSAEPAWLAWGAGRVALKEIWPTGGLTDWRALPPGGIAVCGGGMGMDGEWAILDFERGWTAEGDGGAVGLLQGEFGVKQRVEAVAFGRFGNAILVKLVVHQSGGEISNNTRRSVERAIEEAARRSPSRAATKPLTLAKRVALAANFPADLPAGAYRVDVELADEQGVTQQRWQMAFERGRKRENPLLGLSDDVLLAEYVKRGEALKKTGVEPVDSSVGPAQDMFSYRRPARLEWDAAHFEIVRRGSRMVPVLLTMLEREAVRNPAGSKEAQEMFPFGFAYDVMKMLVEIGDPRAVKILVRVMAGMEGKANRSVRWGAVAAAERLTYLMLIVTQSNPANPYAMLGKGAIIQKQWPARTDADDARELDRVAGLYAEWVDGEGRDPSQWMALARKRAHEALEGNDELAIRYAIAFLQGLPGGATHDDTPERTMRQIAGLISRKVALDRSYVRLPSALAAYGPAAREYVPAVLDEAKANRTWDTYADLAAVGGERAMKCLVEALPGLAAELERRGIPRDAVEWSADVQGHQAFAAYQACRWGIERWAGRTFASDAEIERWWKENRGKSQRDWLEQSLQPTSVTADGGDAKSQYLLRQMLPEMPGAKQDRPFTIPPSHWDRMPLYWEGKPEALRERWLNENRGRLGYDEHRSCFLLDKGR